MDGTLWYGNGGSGTFAHMQGPYAQPERFVGRVRNLEFSGLSSTESGNKFKSLNTMLDTLVGPVQQDTQYKTSSTKTTEEKTVILAVAGICALFFAYLIFK